MTTKNLLCTFCGDSITTRVEAWPEDGTVDVSIECDDELCGAVWTSGGNVAKEPGT